MRVNRIRYSDIMLEWEILKMKAAYVAAEQEIIKMSENGMADGLDIKFTPKTDWNALAGQKVDEFGNITNLTVKDMKIMDLEDKLRQLEETGRKLLEEEKYELLTEAKELWKKVKQQLDNLRLL